jgi:Na+-transporting methylmalonyl-CoA/oxaloacetate decarboxylase gamma subunit
MTEWLIFLGAGLVFAFLVGLSVLAWVKTPI